MRPAGPGAELFAAFSRITAKAFADDRLLACPALSKAPNYGQVLRRFILQSPQGPLKPVALARIALRYALTNGAHLLFLAFGAVCLRILQWRLPENSLRDPGKKLLIIDTFAVLPKIASDRAFRELYLPGLAKEALERGHTVAHLFRLYGSRNPRVLWQAFKVLAQVPGGITELHLLTPADWLRLARHCLLYPVSLLRLIRSLKHFPAGSPESYIREALIRTAGQCVAIGEARRLAGLRLGMYLAARPHAGPSSESGGTLLVSWYENQTVNKCLFRGLAQAEEAGARHVPSLGAQLFLWPASLLNNHPDDGEAALGLVPDKVLVSGPHFLPDSSRQIYSIGPSLRYGGVFSPPKRPASAGPAAEAPGNAPLLALLSYHPEEIRRVLEMLLPLADKGAEIIYKFHPATRPEQFTAWLPMSPKLAEGSLQSALQSIFHRRGVVLGSGSGALAEAVVSGIPVLSVTDLVPGLELNYLPDYGKGLLWEPVQTVVDMEPALRKLAAGLDHPDREAAVLAFRDLLFTEPTPARIQRDFGL